MTFDFASVSCDTCGIAMGVPRGFLEARRIDGRAVYCPNGHAGMIGSPQRVEQVIQEQKAALAEAREVVQELQGEVLKLEAEARIGRRLAIDLEIGPATAEERA